MKFFLLPFLRHACINILASLSLLLSCQKGHQQKEELEKDTLKMASMPIPHFNPQETTELAAQVFLGKIYEALYEMNPYGNELEVLPNLASELPLVSNDGREITVKIKPGIKYQDNPCLPPNRTVKANDFVTTFQLMADPRRPSPHYSYYAKIFPFLGVWREEQKLLKTTDFSKPLKDIKAIDELTLKFYLKRRHHYLAQDFTSPMTAPIPQEILSCPEFDLSKNTVGTGPYLLSEVRDRLNFSFVKNPQYHRTSFQGRNLATIPRIKVRVIPEQQTAWLALLNGDIDYFEIPKDAFDGAMRMNEDGQQRPSKELESKGISVSKGESKNNVYYIGINHRHKDLARACFRQALSLAIDREKFNTLFFNQAATVATSLLPPMMEGNKPPLASEFIKYDLTKAQAILKQCPPEQRSYVFLAKDTTLARQVGEFFVQTWGKLGLKIQVELMPFAKIVKRAIKGEADFFYLAWFVGIPVGNQFFDLIYGPNFPESFNRVAYQNKQFDKLFLEALDTPSVEEQNQVVRKMNQFSNHDIPIIPLVHAKDYFAVKNKIQFFIPNEVSIGFEKYLSINENENEKK